MTTNNTTTTTHNCILTIPNTTALCIPAHYTMSTMVNTSIMLVYQRSLLWPQVHQPSALPLTSTNAPCLTSTITNHSKLNSSPPALSLTNNTQLASPRTPSTTTHFWKIGSRFSPNFFKKLLTIQPLPCLQSSMERDRDRGRESAYMEFLQTIDFGSDAEQADFSIRVLLQKQMMKIQEEREREKERGTSGWERGSSNSLRAFWSFNFLSHFPPQGFPSKNNTPLLQIKWVG